MQVNYFKLLLIYLKFKVTFYSKKFNPIISKQNLRKLIFIL